MKTLAPEAKVGSLVLLSTVVAILCASCTSVSTEQRIANEQSRLQQQQKGYPDRESSAEQKSADAKAEWERQQRKKS